MAVKNNLNINLGLLGHVDSGKTSLAKCLSQIDSTASFDKNPQSQERGITIDLGFSSFVTEPPDNLRKLGYNYIQFTLVDCPGHASLIRTIIGGVHIIDCVILVIDITKGFQTQTAECLVISEITKKPLIVILNKIDLIEERKRDDVVKKVSKKIMVTLSETPYKEVSIFPVVCKEGYCGERGIEMLIKGLKAAVSVPDRSPENPLVLAIDHCFMIRGKGTIITGTILQGKLKINDTIEIPGLKETKKVKSIQVFRQDVNSAIQGDRIGICVAHFNPKLLERGMACTPDSMRLIYGVVIDFNKVKYYKYDIKSNTKYHVSVGYETLICKLIMFGCKNEIKFNIENEYFYIEQFNEDISEPIYALLEFDKPIYFPPKSTIICSKLDTNIYSTCCRISFFGNIVYEIFEKLYSERFLPKLKIYKMKTKIGQIQNVINEKEIICCKMFPTAASAQKFLNMKVTLSTGELGYIESTFGQRDKLRIKIPGGLEPATYETLLSNFKKTRKNKLSEGTDNEKKQKDNVTINLKFKRFIFDKNKKITQENL